MDTLTPGTLLQVLSDDVRQRRPDPEYGVYVGVDYRGPHRVFVSFGPGAFDLVELAHLVYLTAANAAPVECFGLGDVVGFEVPTVSSGEQGVVVWRESHAARWQVGRLSDVMGAHLDERLARGHQWAGKPVVGPPTLRCVRCFAERPCPHPSGSRRVVPTGRLDGTTRVQCALCRGFV